MAEESTPHPTAPRPLPTWVPWTLLAGVLAAGTLGIRAAPRESKADAVATSIPPAAPQPEAAVAPTPSAKADDWYSAEHLIVSHKDTKLGAKHHVTRSREEARTRAEEARSRALTGADFSKLVREYTDEPTFEQTKGVLLSFRYQDAMKPFADAVVAIQPGQISAVAETNLGFHVIKRLPYERK